MKKVSHLWMTRGTLAFQNLLWMRGCATDGFRPLNPARFEGAGQMNAMDEKAERGGVFWCRKHMTCASSRNEKILRDLSCCS